MRDLTTPAGSCTVCLSAFSHENGCLQVANHGDAGFALFREGVVHTQSTPQQHCFNAPYQLGKAGNDSHGQKCVLCVIACWMYMFCARLHVVCIVRDYMLDVHVLRKVACCVYCARLHVGCTYVCRARLHVGCTYVCRARLHVGCTYVVRDCMLDVCCA